MYRSTPTHAAPPPQFSRLSKSRETKDKAKKAGTQNYAPACLPSLGLRRRLRPSVELRSGRKGGEEDALLTRLSAITRRRRRRRLLHLSYPRFAEEGLTLHFFLPLRLFLLLPPPLPFRTPLRPSSSSFSSPREISIHESSSRRESVRGGSLPPSVRKRQVRKRVMVAAGGGGEENRAINIPGSAD